MSNIPESISQPEFLRGIRPLLALLNVEPEGILAEHFKVTSNAIEMAVVAPAGAGFAKVLRPVQVDGESAVVVRVEVRQ